MVLPRAAAILGSVALVGVLVNFYRDAAREAAAREERIGELLDDASDLLNTSIGESGIPTYERRVVIGHAALGRAQSETLRQAKRKVDRALQIDPDNVAAQGFDSLVNQVGSKSPRAAVAKPGTLPRRFASVYYSLGNAFLAQERPDEAIESYRHAIEISPPHPEAHVGIGNALLLQGKLEEAAAVYRLALNSAPKLPEAHHALAVALHREGKFDEAFAQYTEAIQLKPDFAIAYEGLGELLFGIGRMDDAIAQYRKAIDLAPTMASAYNGLGAALAARGELKAAVASYRQALDLEPDWSVAKANLEAVLQGTHSRH